MSVAEALRELKALNPDGQEAASWQPDLLLRQEVGRSGDLLAGWLVADSPTATTLGGKKCVDEAERKRQFNGSHSRDNGGSTGGDHGSGENGRQAGNGVSSAPRLATADSNHRESCQRRLHSASSQKPEHTLRAAAAAAAAQTSPVSSTGEMVFHAGCHNHYHQGYRTSRKIARGHVISVERPRAALQTSDALPWVIACPGCLRHVGTLDLQLAIAAGRWDRAQALDFQLSPSSTDRRLNQDPLDVRNDSLDAQHETVAKCCDSPPASQRVGVGSLLVGKSNSAEGGGEVGREEEVAQRGNGLPTVPGLSDCFVKVKGKSRCEALPVHFFGGFG